MKGQNKTEKQKITELNLLLKEKEQEISTAKQKAGFFARKYAESSEKLKQIKNGKKK